MPLQHDLATVLEVDGDARSDDRLHLPETPVGLGGHSDDGADFKPVDHTRTFTDPAGGTPLRNGVNDA